MLAVKGMCYLAESYLNSRVRELDVALHFRKESVHTNPDVTGCYFLFLYNLCLMERFYLSVVADIIALQIFTDVENILVLVWCLNRN